MEKIESDWTELFDWKTAEVRSLKWHVHTQTVPEVVMKKKTVGTKITDTQHHLGIELANLSSKRSTI
jgi:hypothetical protein